MAKVPSPPSATTTDWVELRVFAERFSSTSKCTAAIGRGIPYQSWLEEYGRRRNVISGTTEWKEVGSHLTVRPSIVDGGRKIRLEVVPGLSYLAGRRRGTVAFAAASAEAVVPSGGEVRLGGDGEEGDDFFSRFLVGYDRQRRVRRVDVFLRATVTSPH